MKRFPIVPSTVTVNDYRYAPRSIIWAGLRWHSAVLRQYGLMLNNQALSVPWCHPDENKSDEYCGWYRVQPVNDAWRFVRRNNGAWMIEVPRDA